MRMLLMATVLAASGCPATPSSVTPSPGSGSTVVPPPSACAAQRSHVEQLYRSDATAAEPKRVEAAVADNTAMVMIDCAADPVRVSPCLAAASTVAVIEAKCLSRLDEAGNPIR